MTNSWQPPQPGPQQERPASGNAKKKRPFYKRWLFWVPVAVVVVIIAAATSQGGSGGTSTAGDSQSSAPAPAPQSTAAVQTRSPSSASAPATSTPSTAAATTSTNRSISQGFGSKDASADVVLGALTADKIGDTVIDYYVPVTVTNPTTERADYFITLELESADGKEQIDTASVLVTDLEAGQVKHDKGVFFQTDKLPTGAKVVPQEIQRTAA